MVFPVDLGGYDPIKFDLSQAELSAGQRETLNNNIRIIRDSLVFFTAFANAKGLGGHTGGAYDIVPELLIVDGFMKGSDSLYPVYFDEAGHRVAIQYMMAVINGHKESDSLLHYRQYDKGYYGHPEREDDMGIFFSSGRLGHLWSYVNGVAEAEVGKTVVMFGSDGSQMEGDNSEAARYAVARNLNVKLFLDDNNVTISGHPTDYLNGYNLVKTLGGHGLEVNEGAGEDIDDLYTRIQRAFTIDGPVALINKRLMAVGVPGIEGLPKGHDVIPVDMAIEYLQERGYTDAVKMLLNYQTDKTKPVYQGSSLKMAKVRDDFGKVICDILSGMEDIGKKILVVDSDLEGSCGLHHIRKSYPEVYVNGGIMERNNYSVAAGFGSEPGRQGIFGTFAAFQEMIISEITMARLNNANVLAHLSHSGVDDMADNTCHFGINNFYADNALAEDDLTRLYFPADTSQLRAMLITIFNNPGLRFVYSTRSATPWILKEDGDKMFEDGYEFVSGKDEIIREGSAGYIISYGEMLYRCLDVVEQMKNEGFDVGLINKPTLNVIDEEMMMKAGKTPFVLIVETQNNKTGLGSRYGTWLLERGFSPRFETMGTCRPGHGGLSEQIPYQGMSIADIQVKVRSILA